MNKKAIVTTLLFIVVCTSSLCYAKHSDQYLFGCYSYLNNKSLFGRKYNAYLAAKMNELSYNITVMDTDNSDKYLPGLLEALDNNGVDALLTDKCWSNDPQDSRHYALVGLSTSSFYRFEAEFNGDEAVKPGDNNSSLYWYGTLRSSNNDHLPSRVGRAEADSLASYGYAWKMVPDRDAEGFGYTDITYRWKDQKGNAVKLGNEVRMINTGKEQKANQDSLYFALRVKISKLAPDMQSDSVLFSFLPMGYEGRNTTFDTAAELGLQNGAAPIVRFADSRKTPKRLKKNDQVGDFTYRDFLTLGSPTDYFTLVYAISCNDARDSGILSGDTDFNPNTPDFDLWVTLRGLSPRVYWQGNCELSLDYIEFEDQIHHNLRTEADLYRKGINGRIREFMQIPHSDIIRYFYTLDEPNQTNIDSYKLVQSFVDKDHPQPITTFYDIKYRNFPMADKVNTYDHIDLARRLAKPQILLTDIYPIRDNVNFNANEANFLQDVLDYQMLRSYRASKLYVDEDQSRLFYPVVQVFGQWNGANWTSWMLPPKATQRALIYLPLCYKPDGMLAYRFYDNLQENGASQYSPILLTPEGELVEYPYIWDNVVVANARAKAYGEMLKSWTWLDAATAMATSQKVSAKAAQTGISQIQVTNSGKGDYKGYIECGYYQDEKGNSGIFAVNRRTDTSLRGQDSKYKYSSMIPPQDYEDYYEQHQPQTLSLKIKKGMMSRYPALYDPLDHQLYKGEKTSLNVQLNAGEGRFLILVESLPPKVKKGYHVRKADCVVNGKCTVKAKANLVCEGDLILLPGSCLTLSKGSSLKVI